MSRKYHRSVFAFLDLLGVKENIEKDNGEFLEKLGTIYDSTLRIYKSVCDRNLRDNIRTKIFSDNIVFECEIVDSDGFDEFKQIAFISAILQEELLRNNLLLRGAITIGDSFLDDVLVFGKALSDAYLLESNRALYPRVILSQELVEIVLPKISSTSPIAYMCVVDRDGEHYIDYLNSAGRSNANRIHQIRLALTYTQIELEKAEYNPKVKQKLIWHHDYLNNRLHQFEQCIAK